MKGSVNTTDIVLTAMTKQLVKTPNRPYLFHAWYDACYMNARRFVMHMQGGKVGAKDPDILATDAVHGLWLHLFDRNVTVKKSVTTMLYYEVVHYLKYKTMKDDEVSYDEILEHLSEKE